MEKSPYKASDFKDAKYNVVDIGEEKVIDIFPELQKYPEFNIDYKKITNLSTEKIFRYVILMYMDNVLSRSLPDLAKRKREAAILAGFEKDAKTRRFPDSLEQIMECNISQVNNLIIRVVRLNNNSAIEQLAVYQEARARQMLKLLNDQSDNEKTKEVHENIRRLSSDIEDLQRKVLVGEKSKSIITSLYHELDNIHLGIRPEEISEAKRRGALDVVLLDVYKEKVTVSSLPDKKPIRKTGRPKKS